MRIKRMLILAGLVAGVVAVCVTGLAAATPGHPPVIPPPYPQVSASSVITNTSFYAWQQNHFSLSTLCQLSWGEGSACNPGTGSFYDMAFEITATMTNTLGSTTPVTFNQLSPLPPTDDASIPSTCFTSGSCSNLNSWAMAADDFVITTTPGVTVTITDIRVLGVYPGSAITSTSSINVCFYEDNGGPIPISLPSITGPCGANNQGLHPTAVAAGPFLLDQYFTVHLTTPKTYVAPASGARHWLAVQVNDPTTTWYWYNAISPFSWPYSVFTPFVRR